MSWSGRRIALSLPSVGRRAFGSAELRRASRRVCVVIDARASDTPRLSVQALLDPGVMATSCAGNSATPFGADLCDSGLPTRCQVGQSPLRVALVGRNAPRTLWPVRRILASGQESDTYRPSPLQCLRGLLIEVLPATQLVDLLQDVLLGLGG